MVTTHNNKYYLAKVLLLLRYIHVVHGTECPLFRPYSYYGGRYCCLYPLEKSAYSYREQDTFCDGGSIGLDSKCCLHDVFMRCPGVTCTTPTFNTSEPCPEDYPNPYWYGLYCCKYKKEKPSFSLRPQGSSCQDGSLTVNSLCCQNDEYVQCRNPPCSDGSLSYWNLSWYAEGNDNQIDAGFSRKLRSTTDRGIVLGRGYSMLNRIGPFINIHLGNAGVSSSDAALLAQGEKKSGTEAENWITSNSLETYTITYVQQWQLFNIVLTESINSAKSTTADFDTRHDSIRGVVIDLIIAQEYSSDKRTLLQSQIAVNSVTGVRDIMANRANWLNTNEDRFIRRKTYMEAAANSL